MSTTFQDFKRKISDCSGICLSSLCLIHCVITPLVGILPLIEIPYEHLVHVIIVLGSVIFTFMAMFGTYMTGNAGMTLSLLISGLIALITGELIFHELVTLKLIGGLLITSGHVVNIVKRRRSAGHTC